MKFEYLIRRLPAKLILAEMNLLGQEGWQVIEFWCQLTNGLSEQREEAIVFVLFERRVTMP